MSTAWYESWFDTEYYHLLYQNRNNEEAQDHISRMVEFLGINKDSKIIDIACGRGRHSIFLNHCGFNVVGIDLAKHSIDFARKFENEKLRFFCHDKRKTFKNAEFDYALNLFTSFGYLDDRKDLLDELVNMKNNLKDSGIFVLDYFNSEKIKSLEYADEKIIRNGVEFNTSKKVQGHQVIKTIEINAENKNHTFYEKVHLITKKEFEELFEEAELEILHIFGDYELNPYEELESDRLILIARKS